ncbi:hypothetical protein A1O3_06933 [Capronia epimyces CBS 606.96]|uniref:Heterokaryon incompatibility domain-containing protein n=1 Tax=Capronia epimyces CBS 606.96 TaxID=1182542 RepID=W9YEB0_9EURO|nr:uncharacterized protein A1O3_06933 [Capronia epimyces CBS 606.96]EXJ80649.1 hypothetical protein A1O3_06933 [Capronia epimyces CBS 606.96]
MNHLLLPSGPQALHIEIPYLLGSYPPLDEPYDNGDFVSYIDRRVGWTVQDVLKPSRSRHSHRDLAPLRYFASSRRTRAGNLSSQRRRSGPLARESLTDDVSKVGSVLREHVERSVALAAGIIGEIHVDLETVDPSLELVMLSVMTLCDTIQLVIEPRTSKLPSRQWPLSDILISNQMALDGWCRTDIQRWTRLLDLHSLYFVSRLLPRDPGNHSECKEARCNANDIAPGKDPRSHHSCNGCADREAKQIEIFEALENGNLPLIHPDQGPDSGIKLTCTTEGKEYLAISHIWSDGLGNPKRNAVFECQLRWILGLSRQFSPTGLPVWLDTISCPVDIENMSQRMKDAYDLAISYMRRTYAEASVVLVLDHSLTKVASQDLTDLEILLRIASTGWTRRLWTYQEGVLARRLCFQFADRAVDIDEVYLRWQQNPWAIYYPGVRGVYKELRLLQDSTEDDYTAKLLHRVHKTLQFRKTSVLSDEALCLATLANLSPEKVRTVSQSSDEMRMQTFYSCLPQLSRQLIFWSGDHLPHTGFRWAPSSFLNNSNRFFAKWADEPSASYEPGRDQATLTSSGLSFEGPGILLGKARANLQSFLVTVDEQVWYHVTCRGFDGEQSHPFRLQCPTDTGLSDISLALLTPVQLHDDFSVPGFEVRLSLVVGIVANEDDIYYAQTICPAFVFRKLHIDAEFPTVMQTYRLFKRCLSSTDVHGRIVQETIDHENAWLLDDEQLIAQYEQRGSAALKEHIRDYEPWEDRSRRWAGTCMTDGLLSLVRDDMHNLFEGVPLADTQKWCLD